MTSHHHHHNYSPLIAQDMSQSSNNDGQRHHHAHHHRGACDVMHPTSIANTSERFPFEIPTSTSLRKAALVTLLRSGSYEDFETLVRYMTSEDVNERHILHAVDAVTQVYLTHWAAKREDDVRFLELLVEQYDLKCDVQSTDEMKMYPIHWASSEGLIVHVSILLNCGMNQLHLKDGSGCTPLLIAAQHGHANLAAFLIQKGADSAAVDESKDTALHWGAYKGNPNVVGLMLHTDFQSVDVDAVDAFGQTPLHLASLRGNAETVQYLLYDAGSKACDIQDDKGRTPLDLAKKKEQQGCIVILESYRKKRQVGTSLGSCVGAFWRELISISEWKVWMNGGDSGAVGNPLNGRLPIILVYFTMIVGGFLQHHCLFHSENYAIMADKGSLHLIILTSYAAMLVCFWLTKSTNPGILEKQSRRLSSSKSRKRVKHRVGMYSKSLSDLTKSLESQYTEVLENMAKPGTEGVKSFPELCHSCHIVKPYRAKHCRVMRRCVLVFDHYCPFVENTIGIYNYSYFFLFLLSVVITIASTDIAVLILCKRGGTVDSFSVIISIFIGLFFVPVTLLLFTHILFFIQNMTSNEYENLKRFDHFWQDGLYVNPWNQGPLSNCYLRCFPTSKLYELPYSLITGENEESVLEQV